MKDLPETKLVYDWAEHGPVRFRRPSRPVMLDDETLRDGLQSPSVADPGLDEKLRILHLMDRLGIETADVGLPGAGPRQREAVETLCREIDRARLRVAANCAGRTVIADEWDALHEDHRRAAVGFHLQNELMNFGPAEDAFGHGGAGGSNHGAWPGLGVGWSYAMNLMRDSERPDPRPQALLKALHACASRDEHR